MKKILIPFLILFVFNLKADENQDQSGDMKELETLIKEMIRIESSIEKEKDLDPKIKKRINDIEKQIFTIANRITNGDKSKQNKLISELLQKYAPDKFAEAYINAARMIFINHLSKITKCIYDFVENNNQNYPDTLIQAVEENKKITNLINQKKIKNFENISIKYIYVGKDLNQKKNYDNMRPIIIGILTAGNKKYYFAGYMDGHCSALKPDKQGNVFMGKYKFINNLLEKGYSQGNVKSKNKQDGAIACVKAWERAVREDNVELMIKCFSKRAQKIPEYAGGKEALLFWKDEIAGKDFSLDADGFKGEWIKREDKHKGRNITFVYPVMPKGPSSEAIWVVKEGGKWKIEILFKSPPSKSKGGSIINGLQLLMKIEGNQTKFKLGEDIKFRIIYIYKGEKPIRVPVRTIQLLKKDVSLELKESNTLIKRKPIKYIPGKWDKMHLDREGTVLEWKDSSTCLGPSLYSFDGFKYEFSKPGKYIIFTVYRCKREGWWNGEIESNKIEIEITK